MVAITGDTPSSFFHDFFMFCPPAGFPACYYVARALFQSVCHM
jgi:hypothetical protein